MLRQQRMAQVNRAVRTFITANDVWMPPRGVNNVEVDGNAKDAASGNLEITKLFGSGRPSKYLTLIIANRSATAKSTAS